jgi:phosphoglycerate kinase
MAEATRLHKRTIEDLDIAGRRVFIRVDFNVPIVDGKITDDTRIRASLPTIRYALTRNATVILASHLGRPRGNRCDALTLRPVAARLSELLKSPVKFAEETIGSSAQRVIADTKPGNVVLLENLRFHKEEESNAPAFAGALADLADIYVNDAFGAAHRAHASTEGITKYLNEVGIGLLMAAELNYLGRVLDDPDRPFVALIGGAKVSSKIDVIHNLVERADTLLIGGAMAYTFLKELGFPVGQSLVENELLETARNIMSRVKTRDISFELPVDHVVTFKTDGSGAYEVLEVDNPAIGNRLGVDIGPKTVEHYSSILAGASTVVWNGPMGIFETDVFANGTKGVAAAVAAGSGTTIVGGGDSIAAIAGLGVKDHISHISTGGGASLEFLGGRTLPGVAAIPDRLADKSV